MITFTNDDNPASGKDERGVMMPIRMESKQALFDFLKEALPLPSYFGHNWDALEECLSDPSVLGAQKVVLLHHDLPLENEPTEQRTYLKILAAAAEESARLDVVFPERVREQVTAAVAHRSN